MSEPGPVKPENRSEARLVVDVALEMYDMDNHALLGIGRVLNLTTGGACVESTTSLEGRANLFVRMLLDNRLVAVPVRVVWEKSFPHTFEYGLKFGSYPKDMRDAIQKFLKEKKTLYQDMDFISFHPNRRKVPRDNS